jgi:hypothetical protein
MAQGSESTRVPEGTAVDAGKQRAAAEMKKMEKEKLDKDAMDIAERGMEEMHEDEKPNIPGDTIFTK